MIVVRPVGPPAMVVSGEPPTLAVIIELKTLGVGNIYTYNKQVIDLIMSKSPDSASTFVSDEHRGALWRESLIVVDTCFGGFVMLAQIILLGLSRAWLLEKLPLKLMNLYYYLPNIFGLERVPYRGGKKAGTDGNEYRNPLITSEESREATGEYEEKERESSERQAPHEREREQREADSGEHEERNRER
ncbi:hypothetical protein Scep_026317 [Stephania cephalantha]|uniref:Uncharacterized protein n=1 Tax=Stephania cephalantha TaxID=152367 RepID=A0AAP0EQH7_9MAGN